MIRNHNRMAMTDDGPKPGASPDPARYHAFDRARALAMLLGVAYHALLFPNLIGGPMTRSNAPKVLGDWLHSFRMPLFFLIAGFFCRLMLVRYGPAEFLRRRWGRIGLPLMIGVAVLSPLNTITVDLVRLPAAGAAPFPSGGEIAQRVFGASARFFPLYHLWFLWYLLAFVTVAAVLAGLARGDSSSTEDTGDRPGFSPLRLGLAPTLLALAATPALLATRNPTGWFLGLAPAIYHSFPDFLIWFDVDQVFYLVYFGAGWWLHRDRGALPSLAEGWPANAAVGLAAYGVAVGLEARYGAGPSSAGDPGIVRPVAVAIYCLGSACTCFAFLGVFLRHLDSPSRAWRYLADSALWVYLVHVPLVMIGLAACRPFALPWWASTAIVTAASIAASLLLYEALVRRTFLAGVFGPPASKRSALAGRGAVPV